MAATRTPLGTRLALAAMLLGAGTVVASVRFVPPARAEQPEEREAGRPQAPTDDVWTLKGLVLDDRGRPVPGALVRPSVPMPPPGRQAQTAHDGSFTIGFGSDRSFVGGLVAEVDGGVRADRWPIDARARRNVRGRPSGS
jgi:hypothetical protein